MLRASTEVPVSVLVSFSCELSLLYPSSVRKCSSESMAGSRAVMPRRMSAKMDIKVRKSGSVRGTSEKRACS